MISFVKGTVADIGENCLVVENGGIGYEIYMTGQDLGKARIGDEKKIHTFLYVREDILQLYGFFSKDDLGMFKLLIGVNGVGPKGALGIPVSYTHLDVYKRQPEGSGMYLYRGQQTGLYCQDERSHQRQRAYGSKRA